MATAAPLVAGTSYVTDSGLETDLIYNHSFDLPAFAAFVLLRDAAGRRALERYYAEHVAVAAASALGSILETPTWRASSGWAPAVGWSASDVDAANRDAVAFVRDVVGTTAATPVLVSGSVGPRGDGYVVGERMDAATAQAYHGRQVDVLADAGADLLSLLTCSYPQEAIGFALAAAETGLPAVVSFTVETDGRLPDGSPLGDAVSAVDDATRGAPAYYMVNCAHPEHLAPALDPSPTAAGDWLDRLVGVRANASRRSHAELDASTELDAGDPEELADALVALRGTLPSLAVLGGCCGTDVRHIAALATRLTT
jgi:homocysteine S-methyltransferase